MNAKNKKVAMYGVGALILGGVAYFVYSFFKKDSITVGQTTLLLNDDETPKTPIVKTGNTFFADKLAESEATMKYLWSTK